MLDAVQAAGRIPLDMSDGSADYLILSSHKIGGPKGAGAMVARVRPDDAEAADHRRRPGKGSSRRHGKSRRRSPALARPRECARSLSDVVDDVWRCATASKQTILSLAPDAEIFGRDTERLANTTFFAIPGLKAETAQIAFDLAGVALSAGSACSSGKVGPSHVLKAMGYDNDGALRVSIGRGDHEEGYRAVCGGAGTNSGAPGRQDDEGRLSGHEYGREARAVRFRDGVIPSRRVNSRNGRTILNLRRPSGAIV